LADQIRAVSGHTDIHTGNWVDRFLPAPARPYARLARLDRPIGTWLLLFPCWWGQALAAGGQPDPSLPDPWLMVLFAVGAVVMRGAGCVVNDILDRDFDAQVERTRVRPIPSGQVTVLQALLFLGALLATGLLVLLALPPLAVWLGIASLALVFSYPLMKRITWWPQAFLGLTFNWGALMGWVAERGTLDWPAAALYVAGIFWTLGYDTIYAHQDKEDDARIGVKSTALRLGAASKVWIWVFYAMSVNALLVAGMLARAHPAVLVGVGAAAFHMAWQVQTWRPDDPADCLAKFKSNRWVGLLVLLGLLGGGL